MKQADFNNFLTLVSMGFNAPTFMRDVYRNHKNKISSILKAVLGEKTRVDLLIDDGRQCRLVEDLSIQDAVVSGGFLESDNHSRVLYLEHVEYEWSLKVCVNFDGSGYYTTDEKYASDDVKLLKVNFSSLEDIKSVRDRAMCRECLNLLRKLKVEGSIEALVGWSQQFFGMKLARYGIRTFSIFG